MLAPTDTTCQKPRRQPHRPARKEERPDSVRICIGDRMHQHDEKVELLRKVEIFSALREYELDIIARHSEMVEYARGNIVFTQNSTAECMYVVKCGRIGIVNIESQDVALVAQITASETLGELDFLGKTPHNALAMAEEPSLLLRFPAERYCAEKVFSDHPFISASMLYRLLGIVSTRILNVQESLAEKEPWVVDLKKQLLCDKLTGLYNQVFFREEFDTLFSRDKEGKTALLMIKPDNFKEINDHYGHKAGDQLLRLMAVFLQSELGQNDVGVRFRGDEFAAVLNDTDRTGAIARAEAIIRSYMAMDIAEITAPDTIVISASVGIALFPRHIKNGETLIEAALRKMYRARASGGSRIVI